MALNKYLKMTDTGTSGTKNKADNTQPTKGPSTSKLYQVQQNVKEQEEPAKESGSSYAYTPQTTSSASGDKIISQDTWDKINSSFEASSAYNEAMKYTEGLLQQLNSGKTSYTDSIDALMQEIQNRDPFKYDADTDTLFQQALASAMSSGKTAMQDTMGQAAALTGGYGSTYATSAANQAYNAYLEDAYDNIPEYYQMALDAYQMEGQGMYDELAMLNNADATEYGRLLNSYQSNYAYANDIYNKEYSAWADSVQNAYNSAGLQLSEDSQIYDKMATDRSFNESVRQFNAQMAHKQQAAEQEQLQELVKQGEVEYKEPSSSQMQGALKAYEEGGEDAYFKYLDSLPSDIDVERVDAYVMQYGTIPYTNREYTKVNDTINGLWGVDNNDVVSDQYGNTYRLDELEALLPEEIREEYLKELTKLKKDGVWSYK